MPSRSKRPALPKDPSQRAKALLDMATGERAKPVEKKLTPAQEFARSGGLKGGQARAKALSPKKRAAIAKKAAVARWKTAE
jgi:hypothetical protein